MSHKTSLHQRSFTDPVHVFKDLLADLTQTPVAHIRFRELEVWGKQCAFKDIFPAILDVAKDKPAWFPRMLGLANFCIDNNSEKTIDRRVNEILIFSLLRPKTDCGSKPSHSFSNVGAYDPLAKLLSEGRPQGREIFQGLSQHYAVLGAENTVDILSTQCDVLIRDAGYLSKNPSDSYRETCLNKGVAELDRSVPLFLSEFSHNHQAVERLFDKIDKVYGVLSDSAFQLSVSCQEIQVSLLNFLSEAKLKTLLNQIYSCYLVIDGADIDCSISQKIIQAVLAHHGVEGIQTCDSLSEQAKAYFDDPKIAFLNQRRQPQ